MKSKIVLGFLLMVAASGCTQRWITAQAFNASDKGSTLYTAYLETQCFGSYCTQADSKVKACVLKQDNSLDCKNLTDAEKVLNP
jgi:hypothetical protein